MRDLVVREALATMARDAAKRFRELIAAGAEIPYEVQEPGNGSPLCRYEPQVERFVRDHAAVLRELDSFGAACAAIEASGLAEPYLAEFEVPAPPDPRARAELAGLVFLCRMWLDSTDLSFERKRLEAAVAEIESLGQASEEEIDVVVPLRGLTMPTARLELSGATIVRADTVDVPAEARAGEVMGASPWEPAFLAVARVVAGDDEETGVRGADAFRLLITTLRLFKPGGIGLGPHAWVATAANRWRRISTGAGKPRAGGYRLDEQELAELAAFSRALASEDSPLGRADSRRSRSVAPLRRAISRFEAGLERPVAVEALSDNLLALRTVFEGGGPAHLGMAMRVAAVCAEPAERPAVKAVVDRALALERELWSGEPHGSGPVPAETAIELEGLVRAILRDASCGHLGTDLRSTADEILLADGLAAGEGDAEQRGATEEWSMAAEPEPGEPEAEAEAEHDVEPAEPAGEGEAGEARRGSTLPPELDGVEPRLGVVKVPASRRRISDHPSERSEELQMTFPAPAETIETRLEDAPTTVLEAVPDLEPQADPAPEPEPVDAESPVLRLIEQTRIERRERAGRLANLFPRAETEWSVRELGYDRRRRAEVSQASS